MKYKRILPIILCSLFLSGCWDKVEIDRKLFITTIGIDPGKDAGNNKEAKEIKPNDPFQDRISERKLSITYSFPNISALGPGITSTAEDKYINVDASSMEDGIMEATGRSSRSIYLGQTKLIMLNSAILEQPDIFKEILDYLERHPYLNKMMRIVVSEGKAEEFVKFKPTMEKSIENYLTGLMESSESNASILPITLNEVIILLDQNGNAIIPKVSMDKEKDDIVLSGVAVIKNYKLKGFLTPVEVADLEIMRGKIKGGKRVIYMDGHPIDIEISDIQRKIKLSGDKNKLFFNINCRLEAQLMEDFKGKEILSKTELNSIEKNFSESISKECNIIAKLMQTEFQVDPINLREYVEEYKPSLWKGIKDNWDEAFKSAEITVNVDVKIRRIGITK
ncbi:Ger(x)C family spore germination protein [Candidatus Clostridium stratigraminis]|uniref:Ger(X)C family spore germination protein n=1 Tax=Candidatus Clostridium stratigraminis TaxID=3381661 RepID=A0ABW8SZR7_9CLOT